MIYDIAIIGAGCVGAAIAQRLAKFQLKIALLEKEADVAMGTSKANSGIIHQSYFTRRGSLKEELSLRGNELFEVICPQLDVNMKRIGAIFCATDDLELKTLYGEYQQSRERNVPVELIENSAQIHALEPQLNESVIAILHFPRTGLIAPWELTIALAEHAVMNGVDLFFEYPVAFIKKEGGLFTLHARDGRSVQTKTIVNAAGLYADHIAKMVGDNSFNIIPRRGEYIMFDKDALPLQKTIFPTPTVVSKGIVVGPTIHGNFYVGPNANDIEIKEGTNTTPQGLNEILLGGKKLVKSLPIQKHITNFAGIRATTLDHDFIIRHSHISQVVHAAGIDSPGLTACLAIAEKIETILHTDCGYHFHPKSNYIPKRKSQVRLEDLSEEELAQKIRENPLWGQMVCRCEHVTEAEIVEACHAIIPCTNTDMIKRRLRPGMGRCQGGFCLAKVMKIISRERDFILEQVTKSGQQSHVVLRRMKNLCSEIFQGHHV